MYSKMVLYFLHEHHFEKIADDEGRNDDLDAGLLQVLIEGGHPESDVRDWP